MAKFINLDVLEDDTENPMDDLFAYYEKRKIELICSEDESASINKLEQVLTNLDRKLQDLEEDDSITSKFVLNESRKMLKIWTKALEENENKEDIESSIYPNALQLFTTVTHASKFEDVNKAKTYFKDYAKRLNRIKNLAVNDKIEADSLFQLAFNTDLSNEVEKIEDNLHKNFSDLIKNYEINKGELDDSYNTDFEIYRSCRIDETWELDLKIDDEENPEKIFFFLWTFIESLKKIEGVEIELEDIKKGSLWAKFKIKFNNLLAKEETKQVLENSVKSAQAYVEQMHVEVEKTKSEKQKIDSDRKLTEKKTNRLPDEDILKERERLKNEHLKAEIRSANLENVKMQLEIMKNLSDLTGKSIADVDNLSININDVLFLEKRGEKIETGADIQEIAKKNED